MLAMVTSDMHTQENLSICAACKLQFEREIQMNVQIWQWYTKNWIKQTLLIPMWYVLMFIFILHVFSYLINANWYALSLIPLLVIPPKYSITCWFWCLDGKYHVHTFVFLDPITIGFLDSDTERKDANDNASKVLVEATLSYNCKYFHCYCSV